MHDFLGEPALLAQLGRALARLLVERLERGVVLIERCHLLDGHDDRAQVIVALRVLECRRALLALKQQLHAAESALNLADLGDDAHRVENLGRRLVGVVALRHGEHETIAAQGGLDRTQGSRAAGGDRRREAGEDDRSAKRENWQYLPLSHSTMSYDRAAVRIAMRDDSARFVP